MNEIESNENNVKGSGHVAQLDEHKPSKFADAGSNPVMVKNRKPKSQKWLESMAGRKGTNGGQVKDLYKCPFCGKEWKTTKSGFSTHKNGCNFNPDKRPFKGHPQSEKTKQKLSEIGLKNDYRRLMRKTQPYNGVLYDSSWEVEFAKRLESLNETFERPKEPIKYVGLDGKEHNYFPDFYLPNRCVFVEVKNPYLFKNDSKVRILRAMRKDIIWLTSLEQIQNFV